MSMFGGLESMALGGALSLGGSLLGGNKKAKPLFKLEPAYYTGLNQQNEQRAMALGALDRYSDFMYGSRTPRWSPYGEGGYEGMRQGGPQAGASSGPSMQSMMASMPRNLGPQAQKDYMALMQRRAGAGTASGGASKNKNLGTSETVPGFNPPGTGINVPLPWGPGTNSLMDYEGASGPQAPGGFLGVLGAAGASATGQLDDLQAAYLGESQSKRGEADTLYRSAVDEARGYGDAAMSEINQNYSDTVRQEGDRLTRDLAARGFGGSTMFHAGVANDIVPNALAGKLSAISNTRNAQARSVTDAALQRAGAFQRSGDEELSRRYGFIPQSMATGESYRQQMLNAYAEPERMRANMLAQPSAAYFGPYTKGNVPNSGNFQPQNMGFGDRIAGVGGQLGGMLLNYGLGDYFRGGRGSSDPWGGGGEGTYSPNGSRPW